MADRVAFIDDDECAPTDEFRAWLNDLRDDVIEGEFGYEAGEFTVYSTHWSPLYEEGLTPREAWQRALDGFKALRDEERAEAKARRVAIHPPEAEAGK